MLGDRRAARSAVRRIPAEPAPAEAGAGGNLVDLVPAGVGVRELLLNNPGMREATAITIVIRRGLAETPVPPSPAALRLRALLRGGPANPVVRQEEIALHGPHWPAHPRVAAATPLLEAPAPGPDEGGGAGGDGGAAVENAAADDPAPPLVPADPRLLDDADEDHGLPAEFVRGRHARMPPPAFFL